jgi:hypothetical protein
LPGFCFLSPAPRWRGGNDCQSRRQHPRLENWGALGFRP